MDSDQHILDNPEQETTGRSKLKSRVPSDLMIVIGILLSIVGLAALFLCVWSFYEFATGGIIERMSWDGFLFVRVLMVETLLFLFGLSLIIGGVGLIRHAKIGWVLSLAAAIFSVMIPVLMFLLKIVRPELRTAIPNWFATIYLVFFGLILWFLLSSTIRNFFSPSTRLYGIAGVIVLVLTLLFAIPQFLI